MAGPLPTASLAQSSLPPTSLTVRLCSQSLSSVEGREAEQGRSLRASQSVQLIATKRATFGIALASPGAGYVRLERGDLRRQPSSRLDDQLEPSAEKSSSPGLRFTIRPASASTGRAFCDPGVARQSPRPSTGLPSTSLRDPERIRGVRATGRVCRAP